MAPDHSSTTAFPPITINGGTGGTGGTATNDGTGDTGGTGEGPKVAMPMVNNPKQTLLQSPPLFATTAPVDVSGSTIHYNFNGPPNINPAQISLPPNTRDEGLSHDENYFNHLLRHKRGFPLYFPGPSETLPVEYQENGIQIGDVGTVTPEGLFDFLFNIYLPAHHPINLGNVPNDFRPLEPRYNDRRDITIIRHPPGNCLSNPLVHKVVSGGQFEEFPGSDFNFRCRPPQGAILALPHGAVLKRLNIRALQTSVAATSTPSHFEVEVAADLSRVEPSQHCDSD